MAEVVNDEEEGAKKKKSRSRKKQEEGDGDAEGDAKPKRRRKKTSDDSDDVVLPCHPRFPLSPLSPCPFFLFVSLSQRFPSSHFLPPTIATRPRR